MANRRNFMQSTAGGLAAAGLASAFPFGNTARAAESLTVVEWGPPWIEGSKKGAGGSDDVGYHLGATPGWRGGHLAKDQIELAEHAL